MNRRPSHRPRIRLLGCVAMACLTASGCGVPTETRPRQIAVTPTPTQSAKIDGHVAAPGTRYTTEHLYLIRDGLLAPAVRDIAGQPTATALLADLLAGPTDTEKAAGLTSALLGTNVVGGVHLAGYVATVELTASPDDPARNDEVLAYGQLVCTLTTLPDVAGVVFTRDGSRVGIPRGDGSLADAPLTLGDYVTLLAGPSPSPTR